MLKATVLMFPSRLDYIGL